MSVGSAANVVFTVRDAADNAPVAGAETWLFVIADGRPTALIPGRTDAGGRSAMTFAVEGSDRARLIPIVRAAGHREWREVYDAATRAESRARRGSLPRIAAGQTLAFDVSLAAGATVAGRVLSPARAPLAGAKVDLVLAGNNWYSWPHAFAVGPDASWPPPCVTAADGTFEWLSLPAERAGDSPGARFVLTVEHEEYEPFRLEAIERREAGPDRVIRVEPVLSPGIEHAGVVLEPDATGRAGALVRLVSMQELDLPRPLRFERERRCDGAGAFRFAGLPAAQYALDVEADGLCPAHIDLDLRQGNVGTTIVKLTPGSILEGTVLGADGAPAEGAQVHLAAPAHYYRTAKTGARGEFRFASLPASGTARVRCGGRFDEQVSLPARPIYIKLGEPVVVSARLCAAEDGTPIPPPGTVHVHGSGFTLALALGADGTTEKREVLPGTYALYADVPGRATVRVDVAAVTAGPSEPVRIRVPRGGTLAGRVTDASGRPLGDVRVRAWGTGRHTRRESATDALGTYVLSGLTGRCTVAFGIEGCAVRAFWGVATTETVPEARLDAVMIRGGTVAGTVRSPSGTGLPGIPVRILDRERNLIPYELPSTITDAAGAYTLTCVPVGWYIVAAGRQIADLEVADEQTTRLDF